MPCQLLTGVATMCHTETGPSGAGGAQSLREVGLHQGAGCTREQVAPGSELCHGLGYSRELPLCSAAPAVPAAPREPPRPHGNGWLVMRRVIASLELSGSDTSRVAARYWRLPWVVEHGDGLGALL